MSAHTIWAQKASCHVQLAKSTCAITTFGIGYCSDVWFRFYPGYLILHMENEKDVKAIMERRNS